MHFEQIVIVNEPSWADTFGVWVAFGAALIAAASAGIIAWQAIQTRRSTQAALAAVELAQAERMDAFKARVDAEMPMITVWTTGWWTSSSHLPRDERRDRSLEGVDQVAFSMPGEATRHVTVSIQVKVVNDGPRRMMATYYQPSTPGFPSAGKQLVLEPGGEPFSVVVNRLESVQRWVEIARSYMPGDERLGAPNDAIVFALSYAFPGAFGAVEDHTVVMGGTVLIRDSGNHSTWWVAGADQDFGDTGAVGRPGFPAARFNRRYFDTGVDGSMNWID